MRKRPKTRSQWGFSVHKRTHDASEQTSEERRRRREKKKKKKKKKKKNKRPTTRTKRAVRIAGVVLLLCYLFLFFSFSLGVARALLLRHAATTRPSPPSVGQSMLSRSHTHLLFWFLVLLKFGGSPRACAGAAAVNSREIHTYMIHDSCCCRCLWDSIVVVVVVAVVVVVFRIEIAISSRHWARFSFPSFTRSCRRGARRR